MECPPTTQEFQDRVRRQMLDEARRQADRVERKAGRSHEGAARQVVAGALREEGQGHRPLPRSVSPGKLETRMRKTARRTRNGAALLMLVVDNDR